MNLFTILEVAIGLMFVWFLLSMLVSTVQEAISNMFQWRGKGLEQAIRGLLEDPDIQKKLKIRLDEGSEGSSLLKRIGRFFRRPQPAYAPVNQLVPVGAGPGAAAPPANAFSVAEGSIPGPDVAVAAASTSATQSAVSLGSQFYDHPLIRALSLDISKHRPSYIPTAQFAEVVFDLIVQAGTADSPLKRAADRAEADTKQLEEDIGTTARTEFEALLKRVQDTAQAKAFDEALLKSIDEQAGALIEKYPVLEPAVLELKSALTFPPLLAQLGAGIEALAETSPQLKETMEILITRAVENTRDADQALAKARKNVEDWFDNSMQRLSGVYKRRVKVMAFALGILVALLINVDSLSVAKTLWLDQSVRALIVSQAAGATQAGLPNAGQQQPGQIVDQLNALQIPMGWTIKQDQTICTAYLGFKETRCLYPGGFNDTANQLFTPTAGLSLLGILITGIAAGQGVPFWFDLLSKLVSLRTSVAPSKASEGK